jgi:hypothetical protein
MIGAQNVKTILMAPVTNAAATTNVMSFDRSGFDYCVIDILSGTTSSQTNAIASIIVAESDTLSTPSLMEQIPAFSGSAATNTSYGWAIPAVTATSQGSVITLQMDLRKRKRYIGLELLGSAAGGTASIAAIARLSRAEESPVSAVEHDGVNLLYTNASGCVKVVTG